MVIFTWGADRPPWGNSNQTSGACVRLCESGQLCKLLPCLPEPTQCCRPPTLCLVLLHYLPPNLIWPPQTRPRASSPLSGSCSLCPWPGSASLAPTLAVLLFCNGHLPFRVHLQLPLWSNSLFTQAQPTCPFPMRLIFPLYLARLCGSKSETSLSLQALMLIGYWMGGDKLGWDKTLCLLTQSKTKLSETCPKPVRGEGEKPPLENWKRFK